MTATSQTQTLAVAAAVLLASLSQTARGAEVYQAGMVDSSLQRIDQIEAQLAAVQQQLGTTDFDNRGSRPCGCNACRAGGYSCSYAVRCGWHLEFENFVWKTRRAATPYAGSSTPLPGAGDPGLFAGSQSIVDRATTFGEDWGFRVGLRYVAPSAWDVGAEYTYFRTNGASQFGSIGDDLDNVHANVLDRNLADNIVLNGVFDDGLVDFASERIDLQYDVVDIHIGKSLGLAPGFVTRPFAGVRLAWIEQQSDVRYQNLEPLVLGGPPIDLDTADIHRSVAMDAGGLRIGNESYWSPWRGSLSLFSRVALSMLYAEFSATRIDDYFNESLALRGINRYSSGFHSVVPVLELAAGARYDRGPFFLQGGYEFANWFNLNQQVEVIGWDDIDAQTSVYGFDGGDLSFDGWFIRAGIVR